MSFSKAQDLLRLARLASSRHGGISLEDIAAEFAVSHRTAQRMTQALETAFQNVTWHDGPDRRRRWRLSDPAATRMEMRSESELEALEIAARTARDEGRLRHARGLEDLRDGMIARMPRVDAARNEADADAVLMALGQVARPGPQVRVAPQVLDAVIESLRGPFRLKIRYRSAESPQRIIEPHGLLRGRRSYLVARQPDRGEDLRNFRIDRIHEAQVLDESFTFQCGFSIENYAARAFGVWQDPAQYGEVVWRFVPEAAERASGFLFHPTQSLEPQPDGSLVVRFRAAGWLEMAWHLYQWGDTVEVLAPERLRKLVEGYQRSDFNALP